MPLKPKRQVQILVTMPLPEGYSRAEVKQYVQDAVSCWAGSFPVEDSMRHVTDQVTTKVHRRTF